MRKVIIGMLLIYTLGLMSCGTPNTIIKGTIIDVECSMNNNYLIIKTDNGNTIKLRTSVEKAIMYQKGTKIEFTYDVNGGYIRYLYLDEGQNEQSDNK